MKKTAIIRKNLGYFFDYPYLKGEYIDKTNQTIFSIENIYNGHVYKTSDLVIKNQPQGFYRQWLIYLDNYLKNNFSEIVYNRYPYLPEDLNDYTEEEQKILEGYNMDNIFEAEFKYKGFSILYSKKSIITISVNIGCNYFPHLSYDLLGLNKEIQKRDFYQMLVRNRSFAIEVMKLKDSNWLKRDFKIELI